MKIAHATKVAAVKAVARANAGVRCRSNFFSVPANSIDATKHRNANKKNSGRVADIACHARRRVATTVNIDAPKIARSLPVRSHAKADSPRTAALMLARYNAEPDQSDPMKTNTDNGKRKKNGKISNGIKRAPKI
jgi:hypothetical protein